MKANKKRNIIVLFLLSWGVLPFLIISFFSFPAADDYSLAELANGKSILEYFSTYLYSINGRYAGMLLSWFNPAHYNAIWLYRLVPIVLIALSILSIHYLIKSLTQKLNFGGWNWIISLVFFLLLINGLPSTAEFIYWYPSIIYHSISILLIIVLIGILIKHQKDTFTFWIIISLLTAFIAGLNEIAQAILIIIFILNIIINYSLQHKKSSFKSVFPLLTIFGSIVLMFLINGTQARMDQLDNQFQVFFALKKGIIHSISLWGFISQHILNWAAFITIILLSGYHSDKIKDSFKILEKITLFKSLIISLLISSGLYIWSYFLLGVNPPLRLINNLYIVFVLILLFNAVIIGIKFHTHIKEIILPKKVVYSMIIALFLLTQLDFHRKDSNTEVVFRSNISRAWFDLAFKAHEYKSEVEQQINHIENGNIEKLNSESIISIPLTIYITDFRCGTEEINTDIIKYYQRNE